MSALLLSLTPYIVGSALVPVQVIIGLKLLNHPSAGLRKAAAYLSGMSLARVVQGLLFLLVLGDWAAREDGKRPVISALVLVLGILLLVAAWRSWRRDDDPDGPPSRWRVLVEEATPLRAFALGLGLPLLGAKLWVFTLGALATIADAHVGLAGSAAVYLLFIVFAQSLVLVPIALRAALPERSAPTIAAVGRWLDANERGIVIAVSLLFGLLFLHAGITGLRS
ncbi:GAP family protein [Rivibacter subsaxonicus]|uniref:Sap-like sulfolipid-1-addressing protein n=1 Tax=Rivibacter subsaxonicus TaxID=457575 RepID=A0A4Q7VNK5_9BURK|nr:GAP family protein [Rivibacter subsaxonicus]RZT97899.1 Sap-like sulfolipid-1-addressing protein [Rivibacter subsaxonicus]